MPRSDKIRAIDMRLIDDLFDMGGGYVLNFSNNTFAEFFEDEMGVDIYDPRYEAEGTSKAKRLRYFLRISDAKERVKTLLALWEYREADRRRLSTQEIFPNANEEFNQLIERLGGKRRPRERHSTTDGITRDVSGKLKATLMEISGLEPQARGYAYERFLNALFDANCLTPRASFRLVGEQIDGSFELSAETYLLEARWRKEQAGASDLRSFNAKVEDKAGWSRGLFVSDSGFTEDGMAAFGRGKRVVCMDGLDIYEMLDRSLAFADVLAKKVRWAAETGNPFARVRELHL